MKRIKNIRKLFNNESKLVLSDHSILLTVIIAPLLYAFFLGSIYLNKDIDNINFAVVDYDKTRTSRKICRLISSNPKINLIGNLDSYAVGVELIKNLEIEGFIVIGNGFEKELYRGNSETVKLYLNTTKFLPSNDINMVINQVILSVGSDIRLNYFESSEIPVIEAKQLTNQLVSQIYPIYNATNSYGDFLLPGLFFLILQQTLLIGLGESVSRDGEKGTLISILNSTGIMGYIGGKSLYYIVLYMSYLLLFTVVVFPFFDIPNKVDVMPIVVVYLAFILSIISLTMLIGTFVRSQARMMEILAFTSYPFFLLSGYSWPVSSMPVPLQWLSSLLPTTPMMEAMSRLYIMGGNWNDISNQFVHLIYLAALFSGLLVVRLIVLERRSISLKT